MARAVWLLPLAVNQYGLQPKAAWPVPVILNIIPNAKHLLGR